MLHIFYSGVNLVCGLKYTKVRLKYYKENTINICDTIQHGIRGGLASVLGQCHVKYMNNEINSEYTGNENYLEYLDFNSLYASARVQALPTGEISVCENNPGTVLACHEQSSFADNYTRSSSNTGYIYTIDIMYNNDLKLKTKKYPFFPEKTRASIGQFTDYQNVKKERI